MPSLWRDHVGLRVRGLGDDWRGAVVYRIVAWEPQTGFFLEPVGDDATRLPWISERAIDRTFLLETETFDDRPWIESVREIAGSGPITYAVTAGGYRFDREKWRNQ
jgi:hypothetical protein